MESGLGVAETRHMEQIKELGFGVVSDLKKKG